MADGAPLFIGILIGALIIALCGAILGLGLNGRFAAQPAATTGITNPSTAFDPTAPAPTEDVFGTEPATAPAATTPGAAPNTADEVPISYPGLTDGACLVNIEAQPRVYQHAWCAELPQEARTPIWGDPRFPACYPPGVPDWHPLDNIFVTLPDPAGCDVAVSDTWTVSGWYMTYVQLAPGAVFTPPPQSQDAQYMIKVLTGSVLNAGQSGIMRDDGQWEMFVVTPPLTVHSLRVPYSTTEITAGDGGAVFAWFVVSQEIMDTPVTSMFEPPATTIAGPFSELLTWQPFSQRTNDANFAEFWNMPGIKLNAFDGTHINYNQWWTVREDNPIDGGYHDHSGLFANNTFGELHMTMFAATATAGMQTQLPGTQNLNLVANPNPIPEGQSASWYANNDLPQVQLNLPIPPGYVHGPLWAVDRTTGEPIINCNGGIVYPWHRLVMGTNPNEGINSFNDPPRYQLWMPFEHPRQFVNTPMQMLANWPNTYLQTQDGNYPGNCPEEAAAATP